MKDYSPAPPEVGKPKIPPPAPGEKLKPPLPKPPSRASRLGWLVFFVLLAVAAYYYWPRIVGAVGGTPSNTATKSGAATGGHGGRGFGAVPVVAVKAVRGSIGDYLTGLGNVTPIYTVTVKTVVDGKLMNIYYKEGDLVQKDAPLVEIDPRPYQVQLEQAEGALARDQALLNNAKVDLDRYADLLKTNAVPQQQYATQKALVEQDEGIVKADQGQIDSAKLNLVYCHINAPITGRMGLRLVDPGNIVHATDSTGLVVITQVQPISVIFPIAEDQLPQIFQRFRAGQKLTVEAWDRNKTQKLDTGALSTMDNQIDQTTATVRLRADFPNPQEKLFPNQFVYVRLLVQEKGGVTLIPTAAIQLTASGSDSGTYVYLVQPDSSVTVRNIKLSTTEGDASQVVSGLAPGDEIVMTGVDKLNEGTKVTAQLQNWKPHTGPTADLNTASSAATGTGAASGDGTTPNPAAVPGANPNGRGGTPAGSGRGSHQAPGGRGQ